MLTILRNDSIYNLYFNGVLKYQINAIEVFHQPQECTYHISGTSVLFEWPGYNPMLPERRLIIFDEHGCVTYDGRPNF